MKELENCCGTTCDKEKLKAEVNELSHQLALQQEVNLKIAQAMLERDIKVAELEQDIGFYYNQFHEVAALLPKDPLFLDPPDGGNVEVAQQLSRYIVYLTRKMEQANSALLLVGSEIRELDKYYELDGAEKAIEALRNLRFKPDVECLAEVRAQAGKEGFIAGWLTARSQFNKGTQAEANYYANQIRQQAKPNPLQQQCLVCGEYHGNNMPCPSLQPMANASGCYFDAKGTLRNTDGSRSIFDDVDD